LRYADDANFLGLPDTGYTLILIKPSFISTTDALSRVTDAYLLQAVRPRPAADSLHSAMMKWHTMDITAAPLRQAEVLVAARRRLREVLGAPLRTQKGHHGRRLQKFITDSRLATP